jgi:S-adenosylmethionine hydrolase
MSRPLIAVLSDFGLRDHYVAAMKGVALGICPEATLVDISHEIAPHDVLGGALELAASYSYFPAGSIFLVVIDPGVGSRRRAIAAEAGVYRFVVRRTRSLRAGRRLARQRHRPRGARPAGDHHRAASCSTPGPQRRRHRRRGDSSRSVRQPRDAGGPLELTVGGNPVSKVVSTYADAPNGELCALFGSSEDLEIALNGGSAASALTAGRGVPVRVRRARA